METEKNNDICFSVEQNEIPTGAAFNSRVPSERETAALKLRLMMKDAEGEDKCTLCKAAECLEKMPASGGMDWAFPLLMILPFMFGNNSGFSEAAIKAYFDAMDKERKEKEAQTSSE